MAHDDSVSSQWDVVVFDRANTPHLYLTDVAAKYPIETVLAAISVKTNVDGAALDEVVQAAARLRAMPLASVPSGGLTRTTDEPYPLVFLYGFEGMALRTVVERLHEAVSTHGCPINGVCIHGAGMVLPQDAEGPTYSTREIQQFNYAEGGEGAFGFFVSLLYAGLSQAPLRAPDLPRYMNLARLMGHIPDAD